MALLVHEESNKVLEMDVRLGVVVSARVSYVLTGLTQHDYTVLYEAMTASGIPAYGDPLDTSRGLNAILSDYNIKVREDDPGAADVICIYQHILSGPYQNLRTGLNAYNNILLGRFRTSLVEETTNRSSYNNPTPVTVTHTYPRSDFVRAAQTETQGGEFKVLVPKTTYTLQGYMDLVPPHITPESNDLVPFVPNFRQFRSAITGRVNEDVFLGRLPRTWLCTDCQGDILALETPTGEQYDGITLARYIISIEWEDANIGEHDPTVVFIDRRTNRPPPGLVAGTGYKTLVWYPAELMNSLFGTANVEGNEDLLG